MGDLLGVPVTGATARGGGSDGSRTWRNEGLSARAAPTTQARRRYDGGDGGRHRRGRAEANHWAVPAHGLRGRGHDRDRHLHRPHAGGAGRRPRNHPVVRLRRDGGRAHRDLLRGAGEHGAGLRLVLLVRVRHAGRGGCDRRRGVSAARVRRGVRRGRGRLVAVSQRVLRQRLRVDHPRRSVERARTGRHLQPARGDPDLHVHAVAHPRSQ
jgi:hypothetical protein